VDYFNSFLLWAHLISLAVAGATIFGMPVIMANMAGVAADVRPRVGAIAKRLSTMSRGALLVLLVTGPLLVWLKYNGFDGFGFWFWVKMALVVVQIAIVVYSGINGKRAQGGDAAAMARAPAIGAVGMITFLLIIAAAVLSFG
jgi:protoporphyrinogen IX oxidase